MREYNYDYDMAIVHALYKYGSIGRRQLKKIIESKEYLNKNISSIPSTITLKEC